MPRGVFLDASSRERRVNHAKALGETRAKAFSIGDRHGHLTIIEIGSDFLRCRCDCGDERAYPRRRFLARGISCGCLKGGTAKRSNLTNERFGRLVVIELVGVKPPRWRCRCDCGREIEKTTKSLRDRGLHSCGCAKTVSVRVLGETMSLSRAAALLGLSLSAVFERIKAGRWDDEYIARHLSAERKGVKPRSRPKPRRVA
jgi:hypothetical protein